MASNWAQASASVAKAVEVTLECPRCHAMNRPRATIIELDPQLWVALCGVCSHSWAVEPEA